MPVTKKSSGSDGVPTRRQYTALVRALSESPMKEALIAAGLGHVSYGILCRHLLLLGKALPPTLERSPLNVSDEDIDKHLDKISSKERPMPWTGPD